MRAFEGAPPGSSATGVARACPDATLLPLDVKPLPALRRLCMLVLLTVTACIREDTAPCGPRLGGVPAGVLPRLDCRSHIVSVAGPQSDIAAIVALPAGAIVLALRDPDYLVLLAPDTLRTTRLLLPDTAAAQRPIGIVATDDTTVSVLFYPLGDIAEYSLPSLSRRSIIRSVTRASSVAPWRNRYAATHAARDSGIVVTTHGAHRTSSAIFSDRFANSPRALNLFGRALVATAETTLAVISDVADVSILLAQDLRVLDSVTFPVRRREGAPLDLAATIARLDSSGPALSRFGASSPAALAFAASGSLRVVFEDLESNAGQWGSLAYLSSASPRHGAECVDVPIEGATLPRRRFAFRGDTLFIAWLDAQTKTRVVLERRLFDASRCALSP